MARYVDAYKIEYEDITDENGDTYMVAHAPQIEKLETEDVVPVIHAKWMDRKDYHSCSNCGAVLEEDYKWHYHAYCYHCGARMNAE